MYSERNNGINWLNILIKVVFVVLFILLIIWLFPKVPNMKPFYSNVFRENISYMQDAAESYFTDDKMPKNVGDSVEITLGEMIEKNIILPFVDKDGKECDTKASYVQITKNKEDYTMTVNLVCPSEKNTLKKTLACHTYCENCDKSVAVEYQYRQPVTTDKTELSCPKGGTLKDGTCYIYENTTYKALEKTTGGELYCNTGDTLKDDKCIKTTTYTAKTGSNGSYYTCNGTDKLSGSTCTTTKTVSIPVVSGGSEYKATTKTVVLGNATAKTEVVSTSNPTGGKTTTTYVNATSTTSPSVDYKNGVSLVSATSLKREGYSCKAATVKNTCSTCNSTSAAVYDCTKTRTVTTYTCANGETPTADHKCPVTTTTSGTTCTSGNYNSKTGKCEVTKTTYTCANGTANQTTGKCEKVETSCPDGGVLSGNMCIVSGTTSYINTTVEDTYKATLVSGGTYNYCDGNDTRNGSTCTHTETYTPSKKDTKTTYSCPNGGDLKDKNCVVSKLKESYKATSTTKKVTTYNYKWSSEESLTGWTKTGKTREITK